MQGTATADFGDDRIPRGLVQGVDAICHPRGAKGVEDWLNGIQLGLPQHEGRDQICRGCSAKDQAPRLSGPVTTTRSIRATCRRHTELACGPPKNSSTRPFELKDEAALVQLGLEHLHERTIATSGSTCYPPARGESPIRGPKAPPASGPPQVDCVRTGDLDRGHDTTIRTHCRRQYPRHHVARKCPGRARPRLHAVRVLRLCRNRSRPGPTRHLA